MSRSRLRSLALASALALAAIAIAACGGDGGGDGARSSPPPIPTEGVPDALAANLDEANQIIDGAAAALGAKLAELRGHPIVVNQWGSWCPPCRAEFPFFAESAADHAAEVAFLGIDIQDRQSAAEDFLAEFPTPYPHIFDQDAEGVRTLDWGGVSPTTWFIDERGEVVHQRPGAYPDRDALEADIEEHLLGS